MALSNKGIEEGSVPFQRSITSQEACGCLASQGLFPLDFLAFHPWQSIWEEQQSKTWVICEPNRMKQLETEQKPGISEAGWCVKLGQVPGAG